MLVVNDRIRISLRELRFQFVRSSGAGGQNVNKVNTKAVLRWNVHRTRALPADTKKRLIAKNGRRINEDGELILSSQRFREQARNIADVTEKLRAMVAEAAIAPRRRKPTKPTKGSKERRLTTKRKTSLTKQRRGRVRGSDD